MRRTTIAAIMLVSLSLTVFAQSEPLQFTLNGIIDLPAYKRAVLTISRPDGRPQFGDGEFWREGQERNHELQVLQIDAAKGLVKVRQNNSNADLTLPTADGTAASGRRPTIQLQAASLEQLLKLYAETTERTVLYASLPKLKFDLQSSATNQAEAATALLAALKEKGITLVMDGDKFAEAVPDSLASKVIPKSAQIKSEKKSADSNCMPPGIMNFESVGAEPVADIFANLQGFSGIEVNPQFDLSRITISLKTQTQMTKEEAAYALEVVFRLNGFQMVPAEHNHMKAIALSAE